MRPMLHVDKYNYIVKYYLYASLSFQAVFLIVQRGIYSRAKFKKSIEWGC